ncbi:FAD-dependent oxidoreductase [Streptomyces sp. NPDC057910]|uniref:NAD(P)/FAD-dependent oxidoreductase n=1 Tax=Streptomyces sp. NPDC057910 TaxID=3346278 RepID=UPI0036E1DECF
MSGPRGAGLSGRVQEAGAAVACAGQDNAGVTLLQHATAGTMTDADGDACEQAPGTAGGGGSGPDGEEGTRPSAQCRRPEPDTHRPSPARGHRYDVVIVGSRLAGASTALLLARRGHRVLLIDRARFPGPAATSANLIHPPGVHRLRTWGVLGRLTAHDIPAITRYSLRTADVCLEAALPAVGDVDHALSPPRAALDHALVRCAVEAGADLREGATVQGLLRDASGAIAGVWGTSGGQPFTEKAALVIGADGKHSRIARLVGAVKYRDEPVLSKSYWAHWSGLEQEPLARTYRGRRQHAFTWSAHDGLTVVGVAWPAARFPAGLSDHDIDRAVIEAFHHADADFAQRLRGSVRAGRWLTGAVPNFLRTPHGQGWALVGDAGATQDPITASGITHAVLSAELLADAVHEALTGARLMSHALADYGCRRDLLIGDYYDCTRYYARIRETSPAGRALIAAVSRSERHARAMIGLLAATVPPADFYTRGVFRDLIGHLGDSAVLPRRIRFPRWLLRGLPGNPARAAALADRLIARNLGPMGDLLLASPRP